MFLMCPAIFNMKTRVEDLTSPRIGLYSSVVNHTVKFNADSAANSAANSAAGEDSTGTWDCGTPA